jgi:flagellar FliL protein
MARATETANEAPAPPKRATKFKWVAVVLVVLVAGAVGYLALLKPSSEDAKPTPGEVLALEPIQVNLAQGRYLRIGIALQLTEETAEVDGSKALDATIKQFSGTSVGELSNDKTRRALKEQLERTVVEMYQDEVMALYLVEFVTQ